MGYGRGRFSSRTKTNQTFTLNITSMTDMFTILLVFLLQTYSTAEFQVVPEKGVSLPVSNSETNPIEAVKISVSLTELKVEDKVVLTLQNGRFSAQDIDPHDKNFIPAFFNELKNFQPKKKLADPVLAKKDSAQPAETRKIASADSAEATIANADEGKVLIQADSKLAYDVVKRVMYTSSMAGYPRMKMATVVGK